MSLRPAVLALCATLFVAIIGCTKKESSEPSGPPPPTAVVNPATAGSIIGTVKLEGEPPTFRPIDMSAEPTCVKANPTAVIPLSLYSGAIMRSRMSSCISNQASADITSIRRKRRLCWIRRAACTFRECWL